MRRVPESEPILQSIAAVTAAPLDQVRQVVATLRDVVDGLFLDGYSIFAPPFVLAYPTDPVATLFQERISSATEADLDAWYVADAELTARWLGLTEDEYLRHPVASEALVLAYLLENLGARAEANAQAQALGIVQAWFDTFRTARGYRFSTVGLERDLERWLVHHPERLASLGYSARLRHQQLVLPDRRRPDLVFDLTDDGQVVGTLVVELKAVAGYLEAVDQVVGYLDTFGALGLCEGELKGLLIADGFSPGVLAYADEKGIQVATLTTIGYRQGLAADVLTAGPPEDIRAMSADGGAVMTPDPTAQSKEAWIVGREGDRTPWTRPLAEDPPLVRRYVVRVGGYGPPSSTTHVPDREDPAVVILWATGPEAQPVRIESPEGISSLWEVDYARELLADLSASCLGIASRMGQGAYLVEEPQNLLAPLSDPPPHFTMALDALACAVPMLEAVHRVCLRVAAWRAPLEPTPDEAARLLETSPRHLRSDPDLPDDLRAAGEAIRSLTLYVLDAHNPYEGHEGGACVNRDKFLSDARSFMEDVTRRVLHVLSTGEASN